jgi:nucleoside-diphosphate-sugar epimerase
VSPRVLLTGARGFVGRPALTALLARGAEVHAVGRGDAPEWLPARVRWEAADLLAPGAAADLVARVQPDAVLHLAWEATPGVYWTSEANRDWLRASRELAAALEGRRLVTAGSCAEYDWSAGWCRENETPLEPATLYGECKRELGELASAHGRIFFLYGPHEDGRRLVPAVATALLQGERAATSHGRQQRDYLHVDDAAAALVALLMADEVSGPVNIASGDPVPVRAVVEAVADATGRPELVSWGEIELGPDEPPLLAGDSARLREEVGFEPRHRLAEGIAETVAWWRERLSVG